MPGVAAKARALGVATGVTLLGLVLGAVLVAAAVIAGVGGSAVTTAAVLLVLSELGFVAAALAHGLYDAAIFAGVYLQLVGQRVV